MRAVIEAEMAKAPEETEMLGCILEVFVDNPENYNEKDKEELLAKANMLTPSILAGTTSRKAVSKELMGAAGAMGLAVTMVNPVVAVGAAVAGGWLAKILKEKE